MCRQQRDILPALAEGWNAKGQHIQPEIQVAAEGTFRHRFFQLTVSSRQNAYIDLDTLCAADRPDFFFLDRTQQLGLQVDRQLTDLVQENGAALGNGQ